MELSFTERIKTLSDEELVKLWKEEKHKAEVYDIFQLCKKILLKG